METTNPIKSVEVRVYFSELTQGDHLGMVSELCLSVDRNGEDQSIFQPSGLNTLSDLR